MKIIIILLAMLDIIGGLTSVKDCNYRDQFYHHASNECRNCSEIKKYFQNNRNWFSSGEPSSDLEENSVELFHQTGSTIGKPANDVVLSKLISIDQPDLTEGSLEEPSGHDDPGGLQTDFSGYYEAASSETSSLNLLAGDTNLKQSSKKFQKFVDSFARSRFVEYELLGAIKECKQEQNISACQMWSNLCVVSMYSHSDTSSTTSNLEHSRKDSKWTNSNFDTQKGAKKSWQHCEQFETTSICNGLRDWFRNEKKPNFDIQNIYASNDLDSEPDLTTRSNSKKLSNSNLLFKLNQPIQLLVYRYALNGNFLGIEQFGLNDLEQFCLITENRKTRLYMGEDNFVRVGRNREMLNCKFSPVEAHLATSPGSKGFNENVFMDLYLGYPLSNGGLFIKPVPVLIKNLIYNGNQLNRRYQKDASRWKLVHRFFNQMIISLNEPVQIFKEAQNNSSKSNDSYKSDKSASNVVLVFAESVSLDFKFKRLDKGAQLNSILLTIDYNLMSLATNLNTSGGNYTRAPLEVSSHLDYPIYETQVTINQKLVDMQRYKSELDLVLTVLGILSCVWSLIKFYNLHKYYGFVKLNLSSLLRFVFIACDTLGSLFVLVTFIFLGSLLVVLKFQTSIQLLGPTEELEGALITNLKLAFIFKMIGFAHKLYMHLNVDIFFIDWERAKMPTSSQILNYATSVIKQQQQQQSEAGEASKTMTMEKNKPELTSSKLAPSYLQSASFWRPYTVINRWVQMQTFRRQSLSLQLIFFTCSIELGHFASLATPDSFGFWWLGANKNTNLNFDGRLTASQSDALRLAVFALIYLALSVGQILFMRYFREPMIRNLINEFVDLCSVANVSLFAMLYPRYGYYVHGRNANGSSDCGIAEMSALLEREERDLCSNRGLLANSDQQTFVLVLPRIINDHYRKLLWKDQLTASNLFNSEQQLLSKPGAQQKQAGLLKSTLLNFQSHPSFSSNRLHIETVVVKNKAINTFLTNFLEHIYKDHIDYSIIEQRKFEGILRNVDLFGSGQSDEYPGGGGGGGGEANTSIPSPPRTTPDRGFSSPTNSTRNNQFNEPTRNGGSSNGGMLVKSPDRSSTNRAIFYNDYNDSFANLLWLGLEFDLILVELMSLLLLDYLLNKPPIIVTVTIIWLLHRLFVSLYTACARNNLVNKALVDEKFLFS